mmetsp:Transcript_48472/g.105084  ORF Transcript_48472/g.105084 Transcript_48472/m.105084 type:complete len:354 (+) Transcript_48472:32-1093(+)
MAAAVLALAAFGLMVTHMQPAPARTLFVRHSSATNAPRQYEPLVGQCIRCNAVTTRHVTPQACTGTEQQTFPAPTAEQSAALSDIKPSPSMTPRQVVQTMLHALHRSNIDRPRARFGCEVVLRFLAPSNPASRVTPQRFGQYLGQPWYTPLLEWEEYRLEGDAVIMGNGTEAYQQVGVRSSASGEWCSVRWILSLAKLETGDEWRIESVFVQEPDGGTDAGLNGDAVSLTPLGAYEAPGEVVLKVMKALRNPDEPYPLHGSEMSIRYCSPTNAASKLSPKAFQQYLKEPWYRILMEWEEIQLEDDSEEQEEGASVLQQSVLVRRSADESWTVVNWELSLHSGRWLMDALTITE